MWVETATSVHQSREINVSNEEAHSRPPQPFYYNVFHISIWHIWQSYLPGVWCCCQKCLLFVSSLDSPRVLTHPFVPRTSLGRYLDIPSAYQQSRGSEG
ncbi:hypothetical protein AVEN_196573-1 [Araneus ventricosus]|uniref:Uncharacterized protein n=1 Tax=Araneus ventricosus TaxID=182803 RepID=A0A4Y2WQ73_ARAVE|nr:hypothetical protein AVEN_196573-1 [Araneus ventricosus]